MVRTVGYRLSRLDVLRQMTGVEPTTIAWMYAENRADAYGPDNSQVADDDHFVAVFGALKYGDNYYVTDNRKPDETNRTKYFNVVLVEE
jgi:hypothetical protein